MNGEHAIIADQASPGGEQHPPLSCRLGEQRRVAVMGPRACRHHYMRLLAGVDTAAAGEVRLLGWTSHDCDRETSRWLRRRIGFVAPELRLLSVLSGWRNLLLGASYHNIAPPVQLAERAQSLVEAMPDAGDPHQLPACMTQLQHMHWVTARALMLEPAFLFAEDPFRGLERDERARLGAYLGRTAPEYATSVVVATDDVAFVRDYADRILFVSPEGHIDFAGGWPDLEASNSPLVSAHFGWRTAGPAPAEEGR